MRYLPYAAASSEPNVIVDGTANDRTLVRSATSGREKRTRPAFVRGCRIPWTGRRLRPKADCRTL